MDEDYLLNVIQKIEKQKEDNHIEPHYAMREEIMEEIYTNMRQCLNGLLQKKKINYNKTLNSWAVNTITDK